MRRRLSGARARAWAGAGVGRWLMVLLVVALMLPALPAPSVRAADRTVTSLLDNGMPGTLRQEIISALPNDTIIFQPGLTGTIVLDAARGQLPLVQNVTIRGPGRALVTISGGCTTCGPGGTRSDGVRVFMVNSGVTATISGVTITRGRASITSNSGSGGGILNSGTLTVTGSTISGNTTGNGGTGGPGGNGGGISSTGMLTVTGSTISGNSTGNGGPGGPGGSGGGIYSFGPLTVTGTTISDNTTGSGGSGGNGGGGGGIHIADLLTVTGSTISGNTTGNGGSGSGNGGSGGGIRNLGTTTVTGSTISGNTTGAGVSTGGNGGGIHNSFGALTVTGSTISGNTTGTGNNLSVGGGIANNATAEITGSTISGNTAVRGGGGVANESGSTLDAGNITVSGNTAQGVSGGGGILNASGGTATLRNVTVTGNKALMTTVGGGGIRNAGQMNIGNALVTGNTVAGGGNGADFIGSGNASVSEGHNFISRRDGTFTARSNDIFSNFDPVLGPLADNGGATTLPDGTRTQTHALLPPGGSRPDLSPVNNGDNALCASPLVGNRDQRGVTRPQGTQCDIGAFEVGPVAPTTPMIPMPPMMPTPMMPMPPMMPPSPMVPMTPMIPMPPMPPTTPMTACLPLAPGSAFAFAAFQSQWQAGEALAPNFWGPTATGNLQEQYAESPGGMRLVQYFDKGRMELTAPASGTVTNGLLANELIGGQMQVGDGAFQPRTGANIPIAGDPDNAGPTYAQLGSTAKALFDPAPDRPGSTVATTLDATGATIPGSTLANAETMIASYDGVTQHNVPGAFAQYREQVGLLTVGYAKSEPFLTTVKVGGVQKRVMVQVFERRVLTYTPENPDPYKVEMGNIGQHYYRWRYCAS